MNATRHQAGAIARALALALIGALAAARAEASPMTATPVYYYTNTSLGDAPGPITFTGAASDSSFISPGALTLGHFHTSPLPSTASLTYNDTPFTISAYFSNQAGGGPSGEVDIHGTLNGTITGNNASSMLANITSVSSPASSAPLPFPLSALTLDMPQAIAPSGVNGGDTALTGRLTVAAVPPSAPEPTSVALFLTTLGGFGLRHRLRGRKAA